MNTTNFITETLKKLSDKGLIGIKTSFEDEGADFIEVLALKIFCDKNNIPLLLKIAGGEAIRDIKDANKMQIQKLVAPMIESKFALEKFVLSCENHYAVPKGEIAINIESKQCYDNIQDIFNSKYINRLSSITVGRGDLVQSMEKDRYNGSVDSAETYKVVQDVFTRARKLNLKCLLGGSMSVKSKTFVTSLIDTDLLDAFETRNVVFYKDALKYYSFEELIQQALSFELKYLTTKKDYYNKLYTQDISRIEKLSK